MEEDEEACDGKEGQIDGHYQVEVLYLLLRSEEEEVAKEEEGEVCERGPPDEGALTFELC